MSPLPEQLTAEPALHWKLGVNILGNDPKSVEARRAAQDVQNSPLVKKLLSERDAEGKIPYHPYKKWNGAHWVLSILADLGFPTGDESLRPMMEQSYHWLLGKAHAKHIQTIDGRVRRCASQESNAVWYSLVLGLADKRTEELAERLIHWQWPDGGWNCDKRPAADTSSFMESLIPLRALALYAKASGDPRSRRSTEHAADIFLKRQLFKRQSDETVIDEHFLNLHYPCYWHYDILFGLKVMAEAGFIADPRCATALAMLETKRLPDSGFPAEEVYYHTTQPKLSGYSLVNWGGKRTKHMNPFVTTDALICIQSIEGRGTQAMREYML